jgi:hypothetical protein
MATSLEHQKAPLRSDEVAVAQYRSVSKAAILSVFLGLLSALALMHLLFVPVALLAIATALVGLRNIRVSRGELIGRPVATVGLCLATLFLGWSLGWSVARQRAIELQAATVANGWLDLLAAGKLNQAHQLTQSTDRRVLDEAVQDRMYATDPGAMADREKWFGKGPIKGFIDLGRNARYSRKSVVETSKQTGLDHVCLRYVYYPADRPEDAKDLLVVVRREAGHASHPGNWQVMSLGGDAPD